MSQVTSSPIPFNPLLRFADSITTLEQGQMHTVTLKDGEPLEKRIESLELFSQESIPAPTKKEKERKIRELIPDTPHEGGTLEERVLTTATECLQEIAKDNEMRTKHYQKKFSLLNGGIFYGNAYLQHMLDLKGKKLADKAQKVIEKRLNALIEQGSFYHGLAPSRYFTLENNPSSPTGKAMMRYFLKDKSVSPSMALEAVLSGKELLFGDCSSTCEISYYEGLRKVLGAKFDYLFAQDGPAPFMLGPTSKSDPILYLVEDIPFSKERLAKGDWVLIKGPAFYRDKHLNGEGQNWCVLCSDPQKEEYVGLGLNSQGVTFEGIEKEFLKEYNADPVGIKGMSEKAGGKLS